MNHSNRPALKLMLAVCALCLLTACSRKDATKAEAEKPKTLPAKTKVKLIAVTQQQQQRAVEAVGSLFAFDEVTVSAEAEGRVEQVLVDVGDRVSKGQLLARISPVEFELTMEQQRAALAQSRARLGLREEDGELKDVRQAAEVKKAAADLADAEQRFKRAEALLESGVIARQVFDEADSKFKAAKATYDLAVQQVENLRASMQQTQATLNLASKRLKDTQIRAPFAGAVKVRSVTAGQYLKIQTPVMTLVNVDPLRVRLNVPEKMSPWVRVGRSVNLTLEAFPNRTFTGRIARINPSVDEKTRTFEVEALVVNRGGELKPGSFVKATLQSDKVDAILTIPQTAAAYLFGTYKVFVIQGKTLKEREVKLGDHFGERVEILEGLQLNDKVAVGEGGQVLKDGMEVEVVQ
ncbi:MAG: efflux RND transporter periplasmic adaptor subunit [Acidobacteria bacterium]|nr:efflux RND transporter periplasmic adaptor subunit [Acidobacteriota bacterium]MBI3426610.1 efflux RND transporter periplasmic adaptor subunit [Acidobacteriota bacterium]